MAQKSKISPSYANFQIPWWIQLAIGLAFVWLTYIVAISSTSFISAWTEENSSVYETAIQSLRMQNLNPTAPTAIVFWNAKNEDSLKSAKAFGSIPASLRVYGIHVGDVSEIEIRKAWLKIAPRTAPLILDKTEMLKTSFHVRNVPMTFIILPKQKKIFSYWGDISQSRDQMLDIIETESSR